MLENTTCILQAHNIYESTLEELLKFLPRDKILIYDDGSDIPIVDADYRSDKFTGKYEDALNVFIEDIETDFIVRINGGNKVFNLQEPETGGIWLSRMTGCPDHKMDASRYPRKGTSIITGSVISTKVYKKLLYNFSKLNNFEFKFGAMCGLQILKGVVCQLKLIKRSDDISLHFTKIKEDDIFSQKKNSRKVRSRR